MIYSMPEAAILYYEVALLIEFCVFTIKDMATLLRTPLVRRYTYRMRMRLPRSGTMPYFLKQQYIEGTIDQDFPYMSRFFHVREIKDAEQYNRLCTLEYLFQRYRISTS